MRNFLFGGTLGAMAMYFYLQGFGPLVGIVEGWWIQASAPQASALHR